MPTRLLINLEEKFMAKYFSVNQPERHLKTLDGLIGQDWNTLVNYFGGDSQAIASVLSRIFFALANRSKSERQKDIPHHLFLLLKQLKTSPLDFYLTSSPFPYDELYKFLESLTKRSVESSSNLFATQLTLTGSFYESLNRHLICNTSNPTSLADQELKDSIFFFSDIDLEANIKDLRDRKKTLYVFLLELFPSHYRNSSLIKKLAIPDTTRNLDKSSMVRFLDQVLINDKGEHWGFLDILNNLGIHQALSFFLHLYRAFPSYEKEIENRFIKIFNHYQSYPEHYSWLKCFFDNYKIASLILVHNIPLKSAISLTPRDTIDSRQFVTLTF